MMHRGQTKDEQPFDWGGRNSIITVPLDGSIEAKTALPVARLIASLTGATINVLHVAEQQLERRDLLQRLKLQRREETVGFIIECACGSPADEILRSAEQKKAMLVVMTTRGEGPYQGEVMRPVPEQVLQRATCPVVLVRPENAGRIAEAKGLRRILLPMDGAPSSIAAVGPVVSLARQSGAEIDALYVAEAQAVAAGEPGTLSTPRYVDQPQYEWPAWVRECIDRFYAALGGYPSGLPMQVFVRHGHPKSEILRFADERSSDLIALEWRGRLDPTHAETVRGVIAGANCPVLLIRTEGYEAGS